MSSAAAGAGAGRRFRRAARWRLLEVAVLDAVLAAPFVFPRRCCSSRTSRSSRIFALSLDLILGYAGIVSLGHVAYFGSAPTSPGCSPRAAARAVVGLGDRRGCAGAARPCHQPADPARHRPDATDGHARRRRRSSTRSPTRPTDFTGGADGLRRRLRPDLRHRSASTFGRTARRLQPTRYLIVLFLARARRRRLAFRPVAPRLRVNRLRAAAVGVPTDPGWSRSTRSPPPTPARRGRCSPRPRNSSRSTCSIFTAPPTCSWCWCIGGAGYLYGGLFGALVLRVMRDVLVGLTPQYWEFWVGLLLVVVVLVGRDRIARPGAGRAAGRRGRHDVALETRRRSKRFGGIVAAERRLAAR